MVHHFVLTPAGKQAIRLARGWLMLGIVAVAASGLFSILLVLSRTPFLQDLIPWLDFFHTALVVHVDLSVLIWFLSFSAVLWSTGTDPGSPGLEQAALYLAVIGTLMIIAAPFTGEARPLLNNYVPVLQQSFFLIGLLIFTVGFALRVTTQLIASPNPGVEKGRGAYVLFLGNKVAAMTAALAIFVLAWSWWDLQGRGEYQGQSYYEFLFWGAGHVLQFTYTLTALIAWLWLATLAGIRSAVSPRSVACLLVLAGLPVILSPVICLYAETDSAAYRIWFTDLMIYGGLCALPVGLLMIYGLFTGPRAVGQQRIARAALLCSLTLFAAGGILGFLIRGINVTIPAHYHGSIVGITLAFFGLAYYLLPLLNYRAPRIRPAIIQLYLYGTGQLLHIIGLAWSGGYGVQRKTAGAEQALDRLPEIAGMAMMGLGGLIAIIGGILLVVIVALSIWPGRDIKERN